MLKEIKLLIDEIEAMRKELVDCGQNFTDPDLIQKSKQLDELINEYYELTENIELRSRIAGF
ncbi:MAG TPA: aspartyl-phosphate phosphatase Spo0E family protein [Syntrophomonadaceae bacterium]|nr:aspartyl-phosphate phosphatase Spo0E family protein [Syntrophomonadaceae bacterium]